MRIAFVSFSTVPFGPNDLLYYRAAEELLHRGHEVMVHVLDWGDQRAPEFDLLKQKGAVISLRPRHLPGANKLQRVLNRITAQFYDHRNDWRAVAAFKPDVIALADAATYHMISPVGLCDFLAECALPLMTISQYNDENTSLGDAILKRARWLFGAARRCVFVSQRNLHVARRQLCLPLEHGVVIDNPPKLNDWTPLPFPNADIATFACVARLECAVKGQALVLQVLAEPAWKQRAWKLTLFGRGPDEGYLRDLIGFLGLEDRVTIGGHVDGIGNVWERNGLLILASSGEGKPLAVTEAMLCGRPAVVTDVGGNAELIAEGLTGFVAESATLASVSSALERAWSARARWPEMGLKAHEVMRARLTPSPGQRLADVILEAADKVA